MSVAENFPSASVVASTSPVRGQVTVAFDTGRPDPSTTVPAAATGDPSFQSPRFFVAPSGSVNTFESNVFQGVRTTTRVLSIVGDSVAQTAMPSDPERASRATESDSVGVNCSTDISTPPTGF